MNENKIKELQEEMKKLQEQIEALQKEGAEEGQEKEGADTSECLMIPTTDKATVEVLESIETSTDDNDIKVETLCRWAAARAGVIVVAPLLGTVALMANEVYLVSRIAKVYNIKLSEQALAAFLGAVGGHVAGNILATLIPLSVVQIPIAVGVTYSVGKVAQRWMKDGMPSDMQPYLEMMSEWREKAKVQVDKLKDNPLKDIPLGDETKDALRNVTEKMKVVIEDAKSKGKDVLETVKQKKVFSDKNLTPSEAAKEVVKSAEEAKETVTVAVEEGMEQAKKDVEPILEEGKEVKEEVEQMGDKIEDKVAEKVKDTVKEAREVAEKVEEKVAEKIEDVSEAAQKVEKKVEEKVDDTVKAAKKAEKTVEDTVKEAVSTAKEAVQKERE